MDGTLVTANANPQRGTKPEQLGEVAKVSRTVREYLADLARENPLSENEEKTSSAVVLVRHTTVPLGVESGIRRVARCLPPTNSGMNYFR
jgi:hypothetical protein